MGAYEDRFAAMKAAEDAMKTKPKKDMSNEMRKAAMSAANAGTASTAASAIPSSVTASDAALRAGLAGGIGSLRPSKQSMDEASDAAMRLKEDRAPTTRSTMGEKKGGKITCKKAGGSVGSASKRADGIATKGKTRGRIV